MRRIIRRSVVAAGTAGLMVLAAACSGSGGSSAPASQSVAAVSTAVPTGPFTLKVAYSSEYVFDTGPLATKWWQEVGAAFKAKYPQATIQWIPIPGSYNDLVNKLSLLYSNPSTAPDVAELPTAQVALWASSNYLLPLDQFLPSTSWWGGIPKAIQDEGLYQGHVYAVNHGENTSALLYNIPDFKKAGIAVPWQPKTWNDILVAAQKIKAAIPGVTPLWLHAGTGSGANGILQGINNLIFGTKQPYVQDPSNGKWVVDSSAIRSAFNIWVQAFNAHLTPSVSDLFSPSAVTTPLTEFKSGKLAMALGSNFYGGNWTPFIGAPAWPQAPQTIGVSLLPSQYDPNRPASTLGGWDLAVSAKSANPGAAFAFVDTAQQPKELIDAANWAGWVPPVKADWTNPQYVNFAPPYNKVFAEAMPTAVLTPSSAAYSVWAEGMGRATGAIAQGQATTVDQAVAILKNYVTQQLGADKVETLP